MQCAVFLDRDGTINLDPGYLNHPDQMELLPQAGEALALLKDAGYLLVVVSNQSGVGRGLIQRELIAPIHARLAELLAPFGAKIDRFELCFHRPDENCSCRKPSPSMVLRAARELHIDLKRSYFVGDRMTDIKAGLQAGCRRAILVRTGDGASELKEMSPDETKGLQVEDSLFHAAQFILRDQTL